MTLKTLVSYLLHHEKQSADQVYLRQPRQGQWTEYTWQAVMQQARQVAQFLYEKGLKKGDHVAVFSKNCAEWFITDFGITLAGMVNVPLFSNQHEDSIHFVLQHAEAKLVFVGKLDDHLKTFRALPVDIPTVNFNYHKSLKTSFSWKDVIACAPLQEVHSPEKSDLYTIIYSSGTSGTPKGAMYTHGAIAAYLSIYPEDIKRIAQEPFYHLLSYLPLAHVYERSAIQLGSVNIPCDVSFVESLEQFAKNIKEVNPTMFAAVPRIWDVFQHKIQQKLPPKLMGILLSIPMVKGVIQRKIKAELGLSHSKANISGASHLPTDILKFFDNLDIPIQEGYGQSENFAYATLTLLDNRKPGYVGSPRLGVEIKLGEKDELLMKCPCLMKGYFKEEEATKKALTTDGWLRTGDIAEIDSEKRVKIVGRLSENFKNLKGEFIVPAPIEKQFSSLSDIEHVCLVGRELARNVMLLKLSDQGRKKSESQLRSQFRKKLHKVNTELKSYEKISHILIVRDSWTPENNFLTPTLKVKRREIEKKYHDLIREIISQDRIVIWQNGQLTSESAGQ